MWCDSSNSAPQSHKLFFSLSDKQSKLKVQCLMSDSINTTRRAAKHNNSPQFSNVLSNYSVATHRDKCDLRSETVCLLSDFFGKVALFSWTLSLRVCKMTETPQRSLQLSPSVCTHLSDRFFSLGADDWHQADKSHLASDY